MSTTTTNFGFVKPALTDAPPDITATNPNWDKLDNKLYSVITGYYRGNNIDSSVESSQTISLGTTPIAVLVMTREGLINDTRNNLLYGGLALTNRPATLFHGSSGRYPSGDYARKSVEICENGFIVRNIPSNAMYPTSIVSNLEPYEYFYVALVR